MTEVKWTELNPKGLFRNFYFETETQWSFGEKTENEEKGNSSESQI
jgi:hypothetical protein